MQINIKTCYYLNNKIKEKLSCDDGNVKNQDTQFFTCRIAEIVFLQGASVYWFHSLVKTMRF